MGAPLWTQEEKDCFVNFIIPQSQFSSGKYDSTRGLSWKELAPLMETEMVRRGGYPEQRVYTETALSQLYYNRFSARAVSRGQSDMALMRSRPATATSSRYIASPDRRPRSRYVSRFTQTDPDAFLGFSPAETLSVHADPIGHATHKLSSGGNGGRSDRDRREIYPPVPKTRNHQRQIESLGDRKRRYRDYEEDETSFMVGHDSMKYQASHHMAGEDWVRRNYAVTSSCHNTIPSNNASYSDDELLDLGSFSPISRDPFNNLAQGKRSKPLSSFILDDLELPDESDEDMPSFLRGPKTARRNEPDEKVRKEYYEDHTRWEELENDERRKRQKVDQAEVRQPLKMFVLGELDDSSDDDLEVYSKVPSRARPDTDGAPDGYENRPAAKSIPRKTAGMIVDGIHRPAQGPGFGIAKLESKPPVDKSEPTTKHNAQLSPPVKSSPTKKKTLEDIPAKSKAPRSPGNTATKKKEQKNAGSTPTKALAVKKSKKVPSKMTNKLSQVVSKHPIEYTDRPVPFFESVSLPKIPKKGAVGKPVIGEGPVGRGQAGNYGHRNFGGDRGYLRGNRAVGGSIERPSRPSEKPRADGREIGKAVNLGSNTYNVKDVPESVNPNFQVDDNGNKPQPFRSKNNPVQATTPAKSVERSTTPSVKNSPSSNFEGSLMDKFATLESIVARAGAESKPKNAAPWAKDIAAQRGFRESASPVEGSGVSSGEKMAPPKK